MAKTNGYGAEQIIQAVEAAGGNLTLAAKMLKCSRTTVYNYANKFVTVQAAIDEQREVSLDFAENTLMSLIREKNVAATIFFLKTRGKERGYIERSEITGPDGSPQKITVKLIDD